jgi:ATP-binding cassette subfamily C (CFTR/MRP) protein 1
LSQWSNGPQDADSKLSDFNQHQLSVYGYLGLGQCIVMIISFYLLILGGLRASFNLHTVLTWHVIRSPMQFFDTTPIGRIVNRFSRDIDTVDSLIPNTMRTFLTCLLRITATFVIITYKTPLFSLVLGPIIVIYYFVQVSQLNWFFLISFLKLLIFVPFRLNLTQRFYVATTRQLKRLDSITRSPIYSHFGETLSGCSTIRAYSKTKAFVNESNARVELNNICYYPSMIANRWLSVRLEFLGNIMVFSTAIFAVYSKDYLDAGTVGLIVSYAINITQVLSWQVRMISELETNLVSVERINEYNSNELEDDWVRCFSFFTIIRI